MTRLWKTPVLIIADDFTGANDAGAGLASAGAQVKVLFDDASHAEAQDADVWVLNTDSRAISAELAASRTKAAIAGWVDIACHGWIFKKMDSTLRGNPGAEIEALMLAGAFQVALVVPAVPRLGRTTLEGCCFIDGQLLSATEYASDPKTPVTQASIVMRLQEQSALPVGLIPLAAIRQKHLLLQTEAAIADGARLVVMDAQTDEDLQRIIRVASQLAVRPLLVGASGLSEALGELLGGTRQQKGTFVPTTAVKAAKNPPVISLKSESKTRVNTLLPCPESGTAKAGRPVLAVVGSMSEAAQKQIARLARHYPLALIDVDIMQLLNGQDTNAWRQTATEALQRGQHCVIRTCQQAEQRLAIAALCCRFDLNRQQFGEQICACLATLTADILRDVRPCGLFLSGGDVATAIARGLGAQGFKIAGQVAGCVPYGHLLAAKDDLLVLTKAGGFGDDGILLDVFRFLEEKAGE